MWERKVYSMTVQTNPSKYLVNTLDENQQVLIDSDKSIMLNSDNPCLIINIAIAVNCTSYLKINREVSLHS